LRHAASFLLAAALALPSLAATAPRAHVVTANNASCDVGTYAAATLLLPFFDVDFSQQSTTAVDTIFTVINTSRAPQLARVTLWTDLGYPASWFNVFLTGYDAQTISLYDVLARGNYPTTYADTQPGAASAANDSNPNFQAAFFCTRMGGRIPMPELEQVQTMLSKGTRAGSDCPVGTPHTTAVGYVTVDVISNCSAATPLDAAYYTSLLLFDNVLTGDYERINPNTTTGNYAGGNPLVHIRAIPEGGAAGTPATVPMPYTFYDRYTPADARKLDRRQPLPSSFAARFIEGGPTGFLTNLAVWREGVVAGSKNPCDYAANAKLAVRKANIVRFDEHENPTVLAFDQTMPAVAVIATEKSSLLPPQVGSGDHAGWLWMSLDNGAGRGAEKNPYSINRPSQNWVTIQMYAEGRYAVDFDATALANGCTLQPSAAPVAP
jgi:hypothetical protein